MINKISVADAKSRNWDVIVAGSSFAAMFFLYGLPKTLSVLIVEKGQVVPHKEFIAETEKFSEKFSQHNSSEKVKPWVARTVFGGNSNCWWGQAPRFHPDDFKTRSLFGQAEDWLLGYDELEPFYNEVEYVMDIAGAEARHILPRSRPFPYPAHASSRSDIFLQQKDPLWVPVATARSNGGDRPQCCANGICHGCPIDAKFTIQNGIRHFERDNAYLLTGHEVRALQTEAGIGKAALIEGATGQHEIRSDLIALGTNAISNAAILLRSGFTSPALGRYLNEQVSRQIQIDTPIKNFFGGSSITGHGYHFYHDFDRSERAAILIENVNVPAAVRPEKGLWTERLTLRLVAEDIPQADNRVSLVDDEVHIEWVGHSDYSYAGISYALKNLNRIIPAEIERTVDLGEIPTEAHILGTTRMGTDAQTSVVDRELKTHEISNVLSLGAGAFPSCSPANPTLTLSALSLLAARSV